MAEVHRRRLLMAFHHTEAALGAMGVRGPHVHQLFRCRGTERTVYFEEFRGGLMRVLLSVEINCLLSLEEHQLQMKEKRSHIPLARSMCHGVVLPGPRRRH